ncbi:hypothetical protein N431DRAFT_428550 [Stipitochalara longipes BDJ]|nr:hypothetical protein N431DRAFT_428550 [Stipitochalara longipes BDJ]
MQIFTTLLPLLLSSTLVVSTPIAKRQYNTAKVLGDFAMLTRNVDHLTTNLASFVASPSVGISTFSQHFTDFNEHISVTTADTIVVGSFNTTDSSSVANAAASWAQDTLNFLVALIGDEAAIAAAGQQSLVLGYLNTANTATLSLFTALENAVNENEFDTLSVSQEELQAAFSNAISDYS